MTMTPPKLSPPKAMSRRLTPRRPLECERSRTRHQESTKAFGNGEVRCPGCSRLLRIRSVKLGENDTYYCTLPFHLRTEEPVYNPKVPVGLTPERVGELRQLAEHRMAMASKRGQHLWLPAVEVLALVQGYRAPPEDVPSADDGDPLGTPHMVCQWPTFPACPHPACAERTVNGITTWEVCQEHDAIGRSQGFW